MSTRTAEQEQRQVRTAALLVAFVALVLAAVLVALALWTVAGAVAVIAVAAGWWAHRMYGDLREQIMQDRAMGQAQRRFVDPAPADPFEG